MESSSEDIKKLTQILQDENDECSNAASEDSNDLVIDCKLMDDDLIKKCTNPILKNALIFNLKKRTVLTETINKLEDHLIKLKHSYKQCRSNIFDGKTSLKDPRRTIKRLGAPYFKDHAAFPSPINADWQTMKENKQLVGRKTFLRYMWSQEDKYNLIEGVYSLICLQRLQEITDELASLRNKNKSDEETLKNIELLEHEERVFSNVELICSLITKWQLVRLTSTDGTLETDPTYLNEQLIVKTICEWKHKIDWLQISIKNLEGRRSDIECESMWNCYVMPKFSKESWKVNENTKLVELVEKYNYQNWDAIAAELGDHRSAYQCCVHFNAKLCDKFNRDKWTPEEDIYLESVIQSCSVGNYISWGKVSYFFKQRTKLQIYRHYMTCFTHKIKKGVFSLEEDVLLLTVMKLCDKNLKKIIRYFPNRNPDQLRNRMRTLNTDVSQPWTASDDAKIIAFVAKYGERNWKKLVGETNRSAGCIRHRYKKIRRYCELNPGSSVKQIPRRPYGKYRASIRKRQILVAKVVQILLEQVARASNAGNLLNVKYIEALAAPLLDETMEKKERIVKPKPTLNINSLLYDFFKSSYKCVNRTNVRITDSFVHESAERIDILLNVLGANLVFPSLDKINDHPLLDETDKLILIQIINKKQEVSPSPSPSTSSNYQVESSASNLKCIPPSIETLVGFRGILLHMNILKNHSRGKYEGYNIYVKSGPNKRYVINGYNYIKAVLDCRIMKYDEATKKKMNQDEQLFFKRLKLIFQWPYVIADTKIEPTYERKPIEEPKEPKEKQKCGRKPRDVKHARVIKMNELRKKAFLERKRSQEDTDEKSAKKMKPDTEQL